MTSTSQLTCGSTFTRCMFIFCTQESLGVRPHALAATRRPWCILGRQTVRQTNRQADRLTDHNSVTDTLKYWTMRHSKFVCQPRDPAVAPRINTHTSRRLPCFTLSSCACVPVCLSKGVVLLRKEVDSQSLM